MNRHPILDGLINATCVAVIVVGFFVVVCGLDKPPGEREPGPSQSLDDADGWRR
jgi:hypothetical protein